MEESPVRNQYPFVKAIGITFALMVALFLILQIRGGSTRAFQAAGELSFDLLAGGIACGIWGRRAKSRWTALGFTWRYVLCLVVAFVVGSFLQSVGRQ